MWKLRPKRWTVVPKWYSKWLCWIGDLCTPDMQCLSGPALLRSITEILRAVLLRGNKVSLTTLMSYCYLRIEYFVAVKNGIGQCHCGKCSWYIKKQVPKYLVPFLYRKAWEISCISICISIKNGPPGYLKIFLFLYFLDIYKHMFYNRVFWGVAVRKREEKC